MGQEFNVSDSKIITFVTENGVNDCKFFQKKKENQPCLDEFSLLERSLLK